MDVWMRFRPPFEMVGLGSHIIRPSAGARFQLYHVKRLFFFLLVFSSLFNESCKCKISAAASGEFHYHYNFRCSGSLCELTEMSPGWCAARRSNGFRFFFLNQMQSFDTNKRRFMCFICWHHRMRWSDCSDVSIVVSLPLGLGLVGIYQH